ncbi:MULTISPECIES: beta-ketoacyl-[acyl-carrier-protein] synthase family protein [unclassified Microbacterium]|uniref:beta-ketoacyl-[acyl-carrier-protein] synthase family protein n=1 Tax=unclassified Microbacterium TaxID=2609290 RepID=UPI000493024B|nr:MULTISPECIES: beta-ketoacyl-[acyl-carrier-protein] synthase family protein [unclassified Microbacterium]MCV0336320.1 beta-ketoacyl-[acyl-carrier-protein] synthase family protein [Microbacterium sp.]MCV0376474.1 beta-ketoacyl-[acyl-carrier-protein] synthase family protein [Microbacterium sp.]MCV0390903.1 beta-ketoacyl-[acyl-carrier-protein] synthase family protein [Microbacterium sp.]MCV0419740.1 beta-ketoacyl-[acyl-carrier-protein] synthase family protein [Microbacterium sp.]MCV0422743.1 be
MNGRRSVVITGVGAVTPSGLTVSASWASVRAGRSGITRLPPEISGSGPVQVGGMVRGFTTPVDLAASLARHLTPMQQWAITAADEALADAGVPGQPWQADAGQVIVATGSGPVDATVRAAGALRDHGARRVPPGLTVYGTADAIAGVLSRRYGFLGQTHAVAAACASGAVAIGEGLRRIRHGYADRVLVVGMEDCLGPLHLAAHANLRSVATGFGDDPSSASRPFDRARTGFVMAQGAAAVLLESADAARERGARTLATIAGFGATSDAHHATAPDPAAAGATRAIAACLTDADTDAAEVDHVNTHGTGTILGDEAELVALTQALGRRASSVPLTATKSTTGHLLGAAGVVEAVIIAMTLRDQLLPPTMNLSHPCADDWDFVRDRERPHPVRTVLSTSFGFGGHNAALLLTASD